MALTPESDTPIPRSSERPNSLRVLALLYLKLGAISFGGPAAHIAMMEEEVVRRRAWFTRAEFLDMVGVTNIIPGPNSTELAIHIGYRRGGVPGLLLAGTCFIFPAFVMVAAIAWLYYRYGQLPAFEGVLYGIKPVVIAIVIHAILRLGQAAIPSRFLAGIAASATVLGFLGIHELAILFGGAAVGVIIPWLRSRQKRSSKLAMIIGAGSCLHITPRVAWAAAASGVAVTTAGASKPVLAMIFLLFLKIGSVLFGSGYVLLAFMQADFVDRLGWLTERQLLDATAVGQMTPGPLFTTATFAGYLMSGFPGALLATIGIFLPAFVFAGLCGPFIPRLRESVVAGRMLDGLNAASIALMFVVTWHLGRSAVFDMFTAAAAFVAAILLIRYRVNAAWLVLGGGIMGYIAWVM